MSYDGLIAAEVQAAYPNDDFTEFDSFDFAHALLNTLDALILCGVFWPEFTTLDGMTFLKHVVSSDDDIERVRSHRLVSKSNKMTEKAFNKIDVATIFHGSPFTIFGSYNVLATTLAATWVAKLNQETEFSKYIAEVFEDEGDVYIDFSQA